MKNIYHVNNQKHGDSATIFGAVVCYEHGTVGKLNHMVQIIHKNG